MATNNHGKIGEPQRADITIELFTTWAVPVKIEILGAHLEAYQKAFTARVAFQLCARNSQGRSISALPRELIDDIFDHIVQHERELCTPSWLARYSLSRGPHGIEALDYTRNMILGDDPANRTELQNCLDGFECMYCDDGDDGLCPCLPSFSPSSPRRPKKDYDAVADDTFWCCDECYTYLNFRGGVWKEHPDADGVAEFLADESEIWIRKQRDLVADWGQQVTHGTLLKPEWLDLLRKNFGIDVWVGKRETENKRVSAFATMAFLIPAQAQPSERAFKQVLRILKLSPCLQLEHGSPTVGEGLCEGLRMISLPKVGHCLNDVKGI